MRARLRGGEHLKTDLWEQLGEEASWIQRFWAALAGKPALATACGVAVCGLVLTGVYFSQDPTMESNFAQQNQPAFATLPPQNSSTNPAVALPGTTLFDQLQNQPVAPVNFAPSAQ